jgi:hypothetical protein
MLIKALKSIKKAICLWFAAGVMVLSFSTVRATTVSPPTFEEMTDRAELIFVGKVVGSRSEWGTAGGRRVIVTLVEFEKEEVLKGEARPFVTLKFLGGTVGDTTLEIAGTPTFKAGDRELLFVTGNGVQFSPLVAVFHGRFGVRKDAASGREILLRHNGRALRDVAEIGMGPGEEFAPKRAKVVILASAETVSLEDFKARIDRRVADGAGRK